MNRSLYAHSSIPAAVCSEKVSLHPPESYPSALGIEKLPNSELLAIFSTKIWGLLSARQSVMACSEVP
ncbi:MAG: hypothetical protein ABW185_16575 [Sedimenticola sp.]